MMIAAVLPLLILAAPAEAKPRQASCVVKGNSGADYRGPCRFTPEKNGSFSIGPAKRRTFPGGATTISLSIVEPGVAEVRGLTRDGINSRWGEARRSKRDRACWLGSDFSICVY